jgi:chromosome segregation ATPase
MANPFVPQLTEISAVKAALLRQPTDLHGARLAAADAARDVAAAKKRLQEVEADVADRLAEIAGLVAGEKDLYPNETVRKAEARKRGKGDGELQRCEATKRAHEDDVLKAEMRRTQADLDVRRLEDEYRAWRGRLDAIQAEVQLLVCGR